MAQGTGTPKVNVEVTNGNLQRQVQVLDGVAGLVWAQRSVHAATFGHVSAW